MSWLSEFRPAGRLDRRGFWLRSVTVVPLGFWATIAAGDSPGSPWDAVLAAALVVMLVSIWGRRLHDRGRSAWCLLAVLVPVAGALWLTVECAGRGSCTAGEARKSTPAGRIDYLRVGGS